MDSQQILQFQYAFSYILKWSVFVTFNGKRGGAAGGDGVEPVLVAQFVDLDQGRKVVHQGHGTPGSSSFVLHLVVASTP
jgi:hypothetical protein